MKKVLTILMLLAFCVNQTAWAVNSIDNSNVKRQDMNYISKETNMSKEIAISRSFNINADNNAALVEIYDIAKKHQDFNRENIQDMVRETVRASDLQSIKRALETEGLMPKYVGPRYFVVSKPEHLNNITDMYLLLKKYGISDKDMKNILSIITSNHEKHPISAEIINTILNDDNISREDKVYYIYAKLHGLADEDPKIEEDMLNAYKIMKQYPKIFQKDSEKSILGDDVYWVMRFYRTRCRTTEIINNVMNDSSIKDEDKLFSVLGKLKVLALKDDEKEENKKYPPILYEMAEEGKPIITYFWENDANKYYTDEKILKDVYNACKLLKQANIEDIDGDGGKSVLTLHPELCIAEEKTKEVLNDSKISSKEKAIMIGRRIEQEYYKGDTNGGVSDIALKAMEIGLVPKYTTNNLYNDEYKIEQMTNNVKAYELMKTSPAFNDKYIEFLIRTNGGDFDLYETVKKVLNNKNIADKDKPNQVFREFLLTQNNPNNVKLLDAGIISLDNNLYKDRFYYNYGEEQTQRIINAFNLMKKAGFTQDEIIYIIDDEASNEYLDKAIEQVIDDSSIQKEDKFIFACANIEKQKYLNEKNMPESYYKAVKDNIIPLYYRDKHYTDEEFYKKLTEDVSIMRDNYGYTGTQINKVFSMAEDKKFYYLDTDDEIYVINQIMKDDSISEDNKISRIEKEYKKINSGRIFKKESKNALKTAGNVALVVITAPIWLPIAIVLSPLIIWFMIDLSNNGWHH